MRWNKDRRKRAGGTWRCTIRDQEYEHANAERHRMTSLFNAMKARCMNPRRWDYPYYGGRGIELRFASIDELLNEIGPKPGPRYTVDRIDPDGHYEPGNVRWATRSEQRRNQRPRPRKIASRA